MKKIITFVMVAWVIISLMIMGGEPTSGTVVESILLGGVSLGLACLLWKELSRRGYIVTDKEEDDDRW